MKLTGLGLDTALQLAAALAGALLILYLLRMRRRRITVPFTPLWSRVLIDKDATSWLQRLKRLFSFLLWLAIVLLVIVALTDPQPEQELERGKSIVLIIDTSASMAAKEESGKTRFEIAQERAQERIDEMGPHDKMMILAVDGQVRAVTGEFADNQAHLHEALEALEPSATRAEILEALRTSVDVLLGRKSPEIVLISDGAFGANFEIPENLIKDQMSFEHILVGQEQGNIAITGFNIRRYISNKLDYEVFIQVKNFFDRTVYAELTLYNLVPDTKAADGYFYKIIEKRTLELGPGSSELRFYKDLALGSDHLAADLKLSSTGLEDALDMDNKAFVLVPKFQQVSILLVSPGNLFLEAALLLNENFEVEVLRPSDPKLHPGGSEEIRLSGLRDERYDVVIFDNSFGEEGATPIAPAPEDKGNYLYINPKGEASPFRVSEVDEPLIERVDRKHPIARWLALKDLNILRGSRIRTERKDKVIVRAIEGPLIVARRQPDYNAVAVGFSIVESDLVFRVALPVMLINIVDWFMDESNSLIQAYRTGENWHIPVPLGVDSVDIIDPLGETDAQVPTHDGEVVYYGAYTGFYRIAQAVKDNTSAGLGLEWEIAANFSSPLESAIKPLDEPLPAQEGVGVKIDSGGKGDARLDRWTWILNELVYEIWLYAVFGVLVFLILEWITYHRRWTV